MNWWAVGFAFLLGFIVALFLAAAAMPDASKKDGEES